MAEALVGFSVFGDIAGGYVQAEGYKAQAQQFEVQASQARIQAKQEANELRKQYLRDVASTNVFFAGAGGSFGTESSRAIFNESTRNVRADVDNTIFAGELRRDKALAEASQNRIAAKGAVVGGYSAAAGKASQFYGGKVTGS